MSMGMNNVSDSQTKSLDLAENTISIPAGIDHNSFFGNWISDNAAIALQWSYGKSGEQPTLIEFRF